MTTALLDQFPSALASTGLPSVGGCAPTLLGVTMVAVSSVLGGSGYLPMDLTVEMGRTGQRTAQLSGGILGHSDTSAMLAIGQGWRPAARAAKSASRHERELSWLAAHRDQLRTFAGEWIVMWDDEIIAHGRDPLEAVRQARTRGIKNPLVYRVEGERPKGVGQLGL